MAEVVSLDIIRTSYHTLFQPCCSLKGVSKDEIAPTSSLLLLLELFESVGYNAAGLLKGKIEGAFQHGSKQSVFLHLVDCCRKEMKKIEFNEVGDSIEKCFDIFQLCAAQTVLQLEISSVDRDTQLSTVLNNTISCINEKRGESTSQVCLVECLGRYLTSGARPDTKFSRLLFGVPFSTSADEREKRTRDGTKISHRCTVNVQLWLEAQLYAAISFFSSYTAITPLVKLLVVYIFRDEEKEDFSRLCGVIAGVLQAAFEVAQWAFPRALRELEGPEEKQSPSPPFMTGERTGQYPASEAAALVLHNAAFLLVKLVEACHEYEAEKHPHVDRSASFSVSIASTVFIHLHELVLSLATGCGTCHLRNADDASLLLGSQLSSSQPIVVNRGLSLAESDAFITQLLPSFLQCIGFEWTWSETLRECKLIEKVVSTVSTLEIQRLSDGSKVTKDGRCVVPSPSMHYHSAFIMDQAVWACSLRTYPTRLVNVLPPSFDAVLDALDINSLPLAEKTSGHDDGEANLPVARQLFQFPHYYEISGKAVIEYWDKVGTVQAIQADELELVLRHSTSELPMVAQLRAVAYQDMDDESPFSQNGENDGSELLSSKVVEGLVARYRAEVLLSALLVYTQLAVPSQYQELLRCIAPLLEQYLLLFSTAVGEIGGVSFPLFTFSSHPSHARTVSSTFTCRFSTVFDRVCGVIGYQLYPLEWLPQLAEMYHQHAQQERQSKAFTSPSMADLQWVSQGSRFPFSLFAAVSHQFQLHLRDQNSYNKGIIPQICGLPSVVTPPFQSTFEHLPLALGSECALNVSPSASRKGMDRFTRLMEHVFLDMRTDSAHQRVSASNSVEAAAFFHTVLEVKDFWAVACQGFLPSTVVFIDDYQQQFKKPPEAGPSFSFRLLQAALEWCKEAIGAGKQESQLISCREQLRSVSFSCASAEGDKGLRSFLHQFSYNSMTFDTSETGRRLVRTSFLRLKEKMKFLEEAKRRHAQDASPEDGIDSELDTGLMLLRLQCDQWTELMNTVFIPSVHENLSKEDVADGSVCQGWRAKDWLWRSPFFIDALQSAVP